MTTRSNRGSAKGVKEGSLYAIKLEDGSYAYGQVCKGLDFAFFDLKSPKLLPVDDILDRPVAFRIPVARGEPSRAGWTCVGVGPLQGSRATEAAYRHSPVGSKDVFLYRAGESRQASDSEVENLEVWAIWFAPQIEQRLADHFAGRTNLFVAQLRKGPGERVR